MLYKRKEMWYIITMINKYYEDENLDALLKEFNIEKDNPFFLPPNFQLVKKFNLVDQTGDNMLVLSKR